MPSKSYDCVALITINSPDQRLVDSMFISATGSALSTTITSKSEEFEDLIDFKHSDNTSTLFQCGITMLTFARELDNINFIIY